MDRPEHMIEIAPEDMEAIRGAAEILERPGFAIRAATRLGVGVERIFTSLPRATSKAIQVAVDLALRRALGVAAGTLAPGNRPANNFLHRAGCGVSGAVGGFFGVAALAVELPVSTMIMLRSILDIARSQGYDPAAPETVLRSMQVLALRGGREGYFGVRVAMARALTEAATYIAERGVVEEGAPVLARFLSKIATRFGAAVSEKVAAQLVPIIGAAGGAAVNLIFIDDFQKVAWAHFTIMRLEERYGAKTVQRAYERFAA